MGARAIHFYLVVMSLAWASGCVSPARRAELMTANDALQTENEQLKRQVADREALIADQREQITRLKGFGTERPADIFVPVKAEITSLSGGADYDGKPGDDGVTVHLRLRDADGDLVKVPGQIKVQLVDNANMHAPRVLGVYIFDEPARLRRAWHGRFGTQHYTLKCLFPPDVEPPATRRAPHSEGGATGDMGRGGVLRHYLVSLRDGVPDQATEGGVSLLAGRRSSVHPGGAFEL